MHFLIGFIVASWLLWTLKRGAVRLFGRASQRQPRPPLPPQPLAVATAIQRPKHKTARYAIITLLALAVAWFLRGLLLPEHPSPKSAEPSGVTPIAPPKSAEPSGSVAITAPARKSPKPNGGAAIIAPPKSPEPSSSVAITAPQNPETHRPSEDGCEWVSSFMREDGTYVSGHWSSKPGYAGECPLPEPRPLPTPHEKAVIHVGPRGGHFHYSKNGKKVYER